MSKIFKRTILVCLLGVASSLSFINVDSVSADSISITSSGAKIIDIMPKKDGTTGTSISEDEINVTTTCKAGYNFTISTSIDDSNLYLNGDDDNNTSGTYFSPADGTATLVNSPNTWGYYYNPSTTPTETSVFSPVPILGSADTLRTPSSTASETDISDTFSIYYGVAVSSDMLPGDYKMKIDGENNNNGSIVYQATLTDSCMAYTVEFNPTSINNGEQISGTGTMSSQTVHEDVTVNLNSNTFTAPSGYEFIGWNTAQDGTGIFYPDGASITNLTATGTSITLYAVWSAICPVGNICYNDNGANSVTKMGDQSVGSSDTEITLWASNFQREDYGFAGWSDAPDYELNGTNTGHVIYGPNETIDDSTVIDSIKNTAGLKLYAIWVPVAKDDNGDELTFQTANLLTTTLEDGTTLNSKSNGYITALRDSRDDDVYAIAKLDDGKYWMIENLRLDNTATLSSVNTRSPILPLTNSIDQSTGTITSSSNHLSASQNPTQTAWCNNSSANCDNQSMLYAGNTSNTTTSMTNTDLDIYSYGNYYNWYSATAGNGTYGTNTNNTSTGGDLCPAGWRLPQGGNKTNITANNNDLYRLIFAITGVAPANYNSSTTPYWTDTEAGNTEGSEAVRSISAYPVNFVYAGYVSGSSIRYRGSGGYYWTSTSGGSNPAYYLAFIVRSREDPFVTLPFVYPGSFSYNKNIGSALRCLINS